VVAAKAGGALEILKDQRPVLLVEPGNPHALAKAISTLLGIPHSRQLWGQAAKRDAEERFGLEKILQQWSQCIQELIGPKGQHAWQSSTIT